MLSRGVDLTRPLNTARWFVVSFIWFWVYKFVAVLMLSGIRVLFRRHKQSSEPVHKHQRPLPTLPLFSRKNLGRTSHFQYVFLEQTQQLISIVIVQLLHKCKDPGKRFTRYPSQLFYPLFVLTRGFVEFGIPALIALMSYLNLPFPSYIAFLLSSVPCVLSPFILRNNTIWLPSGAREVCVRIRTSHRNRVAMCCAPPPPGNLREVGAYAGWYHI